MTPFMAGLLAGGITGAFLAICYHVVTSDKGIVVLVAGLLCAIAPAVYFGQAGGQLYVATMLIMSLVAMTVFCTVSDWLTKGRK